MLPAAAFALIAASLHSPFHIPHFLGTSGQALALSLWEAISPTPKEGGKKSTPGQKYCRNQ